MKKILLGFIIGVFACAGFQTMASTINTFKAEKASYDILVNGEKFTNTDKPAVTIEGSTYLPLRAMGNALNVPVEWNSSLKRVEVGAPKTETKTTVKTVKSKSLNISENVTAPPIFFNNNKYYVLSEMFKSDYIKADGDNTYIVLPNKDSILIRKGNESTDKSVIRNGRTYIDVESCGIKCTIDGNTLWIEI